MDEWECNARLISRELNMDIEDEIEKIRRDSMKFAWAIFALLLLAFIFVVYITW